MACDQRFERSQSGGLASTKLNGWTFNEGELDRPDVQALLDHHFTEMRASSPPEACHVLPIDGLRDPAIRFLSLRGADGKLLGIGALKAIAPGHGELKSMRTHTDALGQGVGRIMLARLMELAREAGLTRLSCETGNSALFVAANRLYETSGFKRCGPFADYRDTDFTYFYTRVF